MPLECSADILVIVPSFFYSFAKEKQLTKFCSFNSGTILICSSLNAILLESFYLPMPNACYLSKS